MSLAHSADGRTLTAVAGNTEVTRWDVTNPRGVTRLFTVTGDSLGTGAVAFAPGGTEIAGPPTAGDTLSLWRLR